MYLQVKLSFGSPANRVFSETKPFRLMQQTLVQCFILKYLRFACVSMNFLQACKLSLELTPGHKNQLRIKSDLSALRSVLLQ